MLHNSRHQWIAAAAATALSLAAMSWHWSSRPPSPDMGIPQSLARERSARVTDLRYAVTVRIPADRRTPVTGHVTVTFSLSDASSPLALDFRPPSNHVRRVTAAGRSVTPTLTNDHLVLPVSALERGVNVIEVEFVAGDEALNRHDDYLYTLFVPARASFTLPCFDQPDLKARWSLTLEMPHDWTPVANGRESGRVVSGDRLSVIFDETEPLPTYLFAFAAGRFAVESGTRDGRTIRVFHRETDRDKLARNLDALFDLHATALAWLEHYTALPYAFGKYDIVLVPSFQFSGMEHPGAVYYNASSLLLEPSATRNQMLTRASLIAHETAHMWFGNLVTMTWFNDVWLKEVFANLMAAKIVNPSFPDVNHDLRFLYQHVPAAYDVDRTDGANPIRQELADLDEAGSLYGAVIYQKAPVAMRQLESIIGADAFREGLREYLAAHRHGNADWLDVIARLDGRTPLDLRRWSEAWIEQAGRPTIRTDVQMDHGLITRLAFAQQDPRGRGTIWPERLRVMVGGSGGRVRTFDVVVESQEATVPDAVGLPAPTWILPVGQGLEYGLFELDSATLAFLTTRLPDIRDPLTRGAALVALWEATQEGRVPPDRMLRLLVTALVTERDELNVQHMLDLLRVSFWRFTGPDERQDLAARLEPALRQGLTRANSTSLKAAWFNTFRSIALTDAGIGWLQALWRREASVSGLPLAEADETELALELALRDPDAIASLLDAQRLRLTNPDRRARFEFLMPAVSSDADVRDRFFAGLKDVERRRHESWVIDAVRYLHHPLRAARSRQYIRPALDLLPEIQRTGDIFFPKRWADATLSGYQSVHTAADVREFIDALPRDYPARLRWVLLSAADPLLRAARFQQQ